MTGSGVNEAGATDEVAGAAEVGFGTAVVGADCTVVVVGNVLSAAVVVGRGVGRPMQRQNNR